MATPCGLQGPTSTLRLGGFITSCVSSPTLEVFLFPEVTYTLTQTIVVRFRINWDSGPFLFSSFSFDTKYKISLLSQIKLFSWELCLSPTPPSLQPCPPQKDHQKAWILSPTPEVHDCAYTIFKLWVFKLWSLDLPCDFPPPSPLYFWETGKDTQERLVH